MREHRDLEIVAGGSLLCAVAALAIPWAPLGLLFAAPLTLAAPGYAIIAATFARRVIDRPRFLLLSAASSLAVLVLGALLLNYAPGGVRAIGWVVLLLLITLNGCRLAALRRPAAAPKPPPRIRIARRDGGLLLGGALLTAIALALALTTLPAKHARGYTELWLARQAGVADGPVEVGVGSEEQHRADYVLLVQLGDRGRPLVREFELSPGETHTVPLDAVPSATPQPLPVTALLYRRDRPDEVYRRVAGWIPGEPK